MKDKSSIVVDTARKRWSNGKLTASLPLQKEIEKLVKEVDIILGAMFIKSMRCNPGQYQVVKKSGVKAEGEVP